METDTIQIPKKILEELIKIREDLDYIKRVISEPEVEDVFLTKEEEILIEDALKQGKKGDLLRFEEIFGE